MDWSIVLHQVKILQTLFVKRIQNSRDEFQIVICIGSWVFLRSFVIHGGVTLVICLPLSKKDSGSCRLMDVQINETTMINCAQHREIVLRVLCDLQNASSTFLGPASGASHLEIKPCVIQEYAVLLEVHVSIQKQPCRNHILACFVHPFRMSVLGVLFNFLDAEATVILDKPVEGGFGWLYI